MSAVHTSRPIRCVLGMLASDKHSKGIRTLARYLRDQGVEVIYTGEYNTSQQIARIAVSEDADFVGISSLSGNYVLRMQELVAAMGAAGGEDIPILLGGLIDPDDEPALKASGVARVFGADSSLPDILEFVKELASNKPSA
ncbi:cobalamin B12-binding domain-containing protein [Hydrogenophaga sp.]|uniref:cobalamin B12-binding domain-containing protein n=1 Tax=Hydrogenophaga sp. TaxID=1904254 RepID=UPI002716D817|nr:cobalamin B12-binding domain-containing protein [Hydrogenophaga sp.]MDO9435918.1 cobalamin B12-binding domain-containing protein [Hydrogenophaga sp.]